MHARPSGLHQRSAFLLAPTLAWALTGGVGPAVAAEFCVKTGDELRAALQVAGNNGENDEIDIAIGTMDGGSGATAFSYYTSEDYSVQLTGGFSILPDGHCGSIVPLAALTTLSGEHVRQVLSMKGSGGSSGYIGLVNLGIRNGYSDQQGAGLSIGGPAGFAGHVSLSNVMFVRNISTTFIGGLSIVADLGEVTVLDNLFLENACMGDACAFSIVANAAPDSDDPIRVHFGNSTVVANVCSAGAPASCDIGGGRFYGSAKTAFFNNAFAFNDGIDLRVQGANVELVHNNLPTLLGTPAHSFGNLALADPLFVGNGNYRLRPESPLRNGGVQAYYPFFTVDLDGRDRIYESEVDIGAYENHEVIFIDGFAPQS